jgi:hypothetical protein
LSQTYLTILLDAAKQLELLALKTSQSFGNQRATKLIAALGNAL